MQAVQTPTSKLRFVTPDKESSMSTLWQEEELEKICSRELLTEKAADIEKHINNFEGDSVLSKLVVCSPGDSHGHTSRDSNYVNGSASLKNGFIKIPRSA